MLTFTNSLIVRYAETDAMQRAHHSNFLIWFETCRIDLFNHLGLPYDAIESKGYYIPVLSAKVDYLKPVQFNQTIKINIRLEEKPKVHFTFLYDLHHEDTLIATGRTKHVFINTENKVVRIPKLFTELINPYFK